MNVELLFVESNVPGWSKEAVYTYAEKISKFVSLKVRSIKSPNYSRSEKQKKVIAEAKEIQNHIKPDDYLVVLDERGESLSTMAFSKLMKGRLSSKEKVIFVVGGAFGLAENIIERANKTVSLSPLVLSHLVAQTVLMEQIYRALTIVNEIPYHNE